MFPVIPSPPQPFPPSPPFIPPLRQPKAKAKSLADTVQGNENSPRNPCGKCIGIDEPADTNQVQERLCDGGQLENARVEGNISENGDVNGKFG